MRGRACVARACLWDLVLAGLDLVESSRLVPEFFSGFSFTPNPLGVVAVVVLVAVRRCFAVLALLRFWFFVLRSSFSVLGSEGFAFVLINQVQAEPIDGFASIGLARKRIAS